MLMYWNVAQDAKQVLVLGCTKGRLVASAGAGSSIMGQSTLSNVVLTSQTWNLVSLLLPGCFVTATHSDLGASGLAAALHWSGGDDCRGRRGRAAPARLRRAVIVDDSGVGIGRSACGLGVSVVPERRRT